MTTKVRFESGQIVATPAVLIAVMPQHIAQGLARHLAGDWGEIDPEDVGMNDRALANGGRLLSVFTAPTGVKFWIITESDRSVTTVLLPEDY